MSDKILSISALVLSTVAIIGQGILYFKPELSSRRPDTRYKLAVEAPAEENTDDSLILSVDTSLLKSEDSNPGSE